MPLQIALVLIFLSSATQTAISGLKEYSFLQAIEGYAQQELKLPAPQKDGRVSTLNDKGAMAPGLDKASAQFVSTKHTRVLEIGASYGLAMQEMLRNNASVEYHANDLDARHLFIAAKLLQAKAEEGLLDAAAVERSLFIEGDITKEGWGSKVGSYDAILVARVFHFFDPKQMRAAIRNLVDLLAPGGTVYVVGVSPYVNRYKRFAAELDRRIIAGDEFPGLVASMEPWDDFPVDRSKTSDPKGTYMFQDINTLSREFAAAGFVDIQCEYVPLPHVSEQWQLDGRENVILIARKNLSKI